MKNLIKGLSLLLILLGAHLAYAGAIKEYTADMVDVGTGEVVTKYYVTEKKLRMDNVGDADGSMTIIRMDQGKGYIMQPDNTYLEIPLKGDKVPSYEEMATMMLGNLGPKIKREKLGEETVNGYTAEKSRVTATVMGHTTVHTEWNAKEFDFPVRMQMNDDTTEMRNIKIGTPAASVFEIPAGYTRNTELEEMMKLMR
jgi:hypothetical protein